MASIEFLCNPIIFTALSLIPALLIIKIFARKWMNKENQLRVKKYHPIGGTVFNQLLNFNRLHHYMTDLAAKHRTYRLLSPFRNEIYTSDPSNVEYILKTNFQNYGKGGHNYNNLRDLLGDGIFTVDGDKWRQQRKVSSYEFSTRMLRDFSSVVFRNNAVKLAVIVSEAATSNKSMDIQDLFMKSTLDSIFKVAFGVELDSMCGSNEEGVTFAKAFDNASAMTLWRYVDVFWKIKKFLNIGSEAALKKNVKVIDEFVYKLINRKIEQIHHFKDDISTKKDDILSRFLQVTETDKTYLRDIILNFVIAGKDTTAATLSWFIYVLCKHPTVQEKVAKEIREVSTKFTFEGHEAPVYSVCPHHKEKIQFIFSTATDGKIKAWLYDNLGSRVDYDAPGHSSTTMAYSADGTRLFSCGTNKVGESHLVEWNESEGTVKRAYIGLGKRSVGIVQFDTTKNRFLAAGDEFTVKFWDMDNVNMLTSIDAEGGLPASPCIRFNKEGALLAVSTNDNSIKILANPDGVRLLRTVENRTFDASRAASASVVKAPAVSNFASINSTVGTSILDRAASVTPVAGINSDSRNLVDVKPRIADEPVEASRTWKLTEINEPSQCRSLRLPDNLTAMRVSRLIYTNSGLAILALASNAVHKLWKWQRTERNPNGKATASIVPQLWQPSSGMLMTNDISDANPEDAVPCFALSKNDSYVMSASGGKISLFNMMTFKTMTTFMPPPPAATFLAFHPQDNNIIAIGMEDSSIQIYNVRVDEVKSKLKGHQKKITGLAFSNSLNVLISSGADAQLCVWSTDLWERQASKFLPVPPGRGSASLSDTRVQFHLDQTHLLAVHESQIAIYEAPKLECLKQWFPREATVPITYATYSCDSQSIYVSFEDGGVVVLTASTLRLRCRINPTAYLPPNPSLRVYPLVIAAHPSEPNQFALGLTDGGIHVLEPLETEGKWGTSPPVENGAGPSTTSGAAGSEQAQR